MVPTILFPPGKVPDALKLGISPVPEVFKPIEELVFVQSNTVPSLPEKVIGENGTP
jgi:hypothetical protein